MPMTCKGCFRARKERSWSFRTTSPTRFFFQAEDGIRGATVTGVQTCALPISWDRLQARVHGHEHEPIAHASQYGPKTAFGVGMIHGIGAETGSQALLLAGVAGVTGAQGIAILAAFIVGLLASNTLVAVTSATGFIGAQRLRTVYLVVGAVAGASSLVIGLFFIAGVGTALPDLQEL